MNETIQVLIIADSLLARAGLAALLDTAESCDVLGQASFAQVADTVYEYRPDVLLVDLGWQAQANSEDLRQLVTAGVPIVALIQDVEDAASVLRTLTQAVAFGLLLSDSEPTSLALALQTVYNGMVVLEPTLVGELAATEANNDPLTESLTERENEVLQLLAQGMTNKAIAHQLGITDHTVKFHVNAIMTKLNAQSRTEAVVRAVRAGLILL
ncbi:MAG: response regulator transcription factor [Anaerolineae bacterium]|nr:response regulator transcription factor [Anaerolineae bacterium]